MNGTQRISIRKVAIVLIASCSILAPGIAHAAPAPHMFQGACQITGVIKWASYQSRHYTFAGSGSCTGMLDGEPAQDTPVRVKSKGEALAFLVPVLGGGTGLLSFADRDIVFPIAYQQVGPVLRVFVACHGCSGTALGALETPAEAQPEPERKGPRNAVRILTETTQAFTR